MNKSWKVTKIVTKLAVVVQLEAESIPGLQSNNFKIGSADKCKRLARFLWPRLDIDYWYSCVLDVDVYATLRHLK